MRGISVPALLCFLILLAACSSQTTRSISNSGDFDLASEATIYIDNWVRRGPVQVYVHPDIAPSTPPKALFMPFRVTQKMENAVTIGRNISTMIWQTWLQNKVLSTIELARTETPYRPDIALAMGRQRGADLVIGGYITHFVDGGTVGDTTVSIAVEIYDVHNGNLLWSMAQGGLMQSSKVNDYLLVATRTRMPTDPAAAVITALAQDMGLKVRDWAVPQLQSSPDRGNEPQAFRE